MKSTFLPLLITILALAAACSPAENKTEPAASGEMTTQSQTEHSEHAESSTESGHAEKSMGKIMFVAPQEGATVKSPFKVEMGIEGMTVLPAGEMKEHTGHHHLIVDGQPVPSGDVVPKDETHMHFGKGQTSTELTLKPGKHTLTLQFADGAHKSYGPDMSSAINITVE
jgi:hypothetical protein